jgi:tetratricopeptide (TPR) repeat protein
MICPMLSALKPTDDAGRPVNRECIYEECRFFNVEQRDCNLMVASRAMLRMAEKGPETGATWQPPPLAEMDRRLTEVRKDLLNSSLEVQGVVREAGLAILAKIDAGDGGVAGIQEALTRRLEASESSLGALVDRRLGEVQRAVEGAVARRPEDGVGAIATRVEELVGAAARRLEDSLNATTKRLEETIGAIARRQEEGIGAVAKRLEDTGGAFAGGDAVVAQLLAQMNALTELQQKVAERLLEEMSLVGANARKLEQALSAVDKKLDRAGEEGLQLSQLVTLVKGQAEKTHASLRTINEGNRAVIQAIETQLQRDQTDLARRRREEAIECNNQGVVLYYRGALEAAHGAFRQAADLVPDYAEAHNNLGLVLSKLGRGNEAVEAFQEALRLDPKMGEVYNNLGFLYHTTSQFEKAVEMYDQALQNAADSSVAYTNLGNSFYKMKQPEKAVAAWRRAVELDPMNENARRGLRMFQQDAGSN